MSSIREKSNPVYETEKLLIPVSYIAGMEYFDQGPDTKEQQINIYLNCSVETNEQFVPNNFLANYSTTDSNSSCIYGQLLRYEKGVVGLDVDNDRAGSYSKPGKRIAIEAQHLDPRLVEKTFSITKDQIDQVEELYEKYKKELPKKVVISSLEIPEKFLKSQFVDPIILDADKRCSMCTLIEAIDDDGEEIETYKTHFNCPCPRGQLARFESKYEFEKAKYEFLNSVPKEYFDNPYLEPIKFEDEDFGDYLNYRVTDVEAYPIDIDTLQNKLDEYREEYEMAEYKYWEQTVGQMAIKISETRAKLEEYVEICVHKSLERSLEKKELEIKIAENESLNNKISFVIYDNVPPDMEKHLSCLEYISTMPQYSKYDCVNVDYTVISSDPTGIRKLFADNTDSIEKIIIEFEHCRRYSESKKIDMFEYMFKQLQQKYCSDNKKMEIQIKKLELEDIKEKMEMSNMRKEIKALTKNREQLARIHRINLEIS